MVSEAHDQVNAQYLEQRDKITMFKILNIVENNFYRFTACPMPQILSEDSGNLNNCQMDYYKLLRFI